MCSDSRSESVLYEPVPDGYIHCYLYTVRGAGKKVGGLRAGFASGFGAHHLNVVSVRTLNPLLPMHPHMLTSGV